MMARISPTNSRMVRLGRAAEIVRGAAFGALVGIFVALGWGSGFYLFLWMLCAVLIMFRKLWARIVAGVFAYAGLLLNISEHRIGIAVFLALQLVVLILPTRLFIRGSHD